MPSEKLSRQQHADAISCINDFWEYGRKQGFFDHAYMDWGPNDLDVYMANGYTIWLYTATEKSRQVDGVCIYRIEDLIAPDSKSKEPWMNIAILTVRAQELGDTASRMKATFVATNGAVDEAMKLRPDVVGITAAFERKNADLRALVETWPVVQWEEGEILNRFWMRRDTFLPRFDAHVRDSGADVEPIEKGITPAR